MSEKRIKDSIDAVEPETGAKERMYRNIMKKAQQQAASAVQSAAPQKQPLLFARYALSIAACFCLLAIGVVRFLPGNTPTASGEHDVQIGNPFVEVKSAADFKSIGITLDAPAGAQNTEYTIIDNKIAVVAFEMGGKNYTARASALSGDFSGLYGSEEEIEAIDAAQNAVLSVVRIDAFRYYKVTWTNGKINYCLYGTDGADEAQIKSVYMAIIK